TAQQECISAYGAGMTLQWDGAWQLLVASHNCGEIVSQSVSWPLNRDRGRRFALGVNGNQRHNAGDHAESKGSESEVRRSSRRKQNSLCRQISREVPGSHPPITYVKMLGRY